MSAPLRVVYLSQMEVPSRKAHSIQIFKTCAALSQLGVQVVLVVAKGRLSPQEIEETYGVSPRGANFSMVEAKRDWRLLLSLRGERTVFYTRSQRWARLAINTKPLHRRPIVFETHRKAGVFKNDPETGISEPLERRKRIEWIFNRADGVVCAVEETHRRLLSLGVSSLHLWYGWTHRGFEARGEGLSLAYAGTKDLGVVMGAMGLLPGLRLTVFGGGEEDKNRFRAHNVEFADFLPHRKLLEKLRDYSGFIATNEGIKLADYLTLRGVIFAPDLPSVREILGTGAVYYNFGSSESLAFALKALFSQRYRVVLCGHTVAKMDEYLWPEKGRRLKGFLLGFV